MILELSKRCGFGVERISSGRPVRSRRTICEHDHKGRIIVGKIIKIILYDSEGMVPVGSVAAGVGGVIEIICILPFTRPIIEPVSDTLNIICPALYLRRSPGKCHKGHLDIRTPVLIYQQIIQEIMYDIFRLIRAAVTGTAGRIRHTL